MAISVEDTIKTFLECLSVSTKEGSDEEKEKIQKILQKSIVDLCYILIPEVDVLVSERGIFSVTSPEKAEVMKAFFKEQRKVFFALATAMSVVKSHIDLTEERHKEEINSLKIELEKMEKRIRNLTRINNTKLGYNANNTTTVVKKTTGK